MQRTLLLDDLDMPIPKNCNVSKKFPKIFRNISNHHGSMRICRHGCAAQDIVIL